MERSRIDWAGFKVPITDRRRTERHRGQLNRCQIKREVVNVRPWASNTEWLKFSPLRLKEKHATAREANQMPTTGQATEVAVGGYDVEGLLLLSELVALV
jgi:hypothetical protein